MQQFVVGFNNSKTIKDHTRPMILVEPRSFGPVYYPNKNDVLCGRGGRINSHPGNIQFRQLAQVRKKDYISKLTKKLDKAHIAAEIVRQIRSMDPPGHFLKEEQDGSWYEVGDVKAIKKAGQALREDYNGGEKQDVEDDDDVAQDNESLLSSDPQGGDGEEVTADSNQQQQEKKKNQNVTTSTTKQEEVHVKQPEKGIHDLVVVSTPSTLTSGKNKNNKNVLKKKKFLSPECDNGTGDTNSSVYEPISLYDITPPPYGYHHSFREPQSFTFYDQPPLVGFSLADTRGIDQNKSHNKKNNNNNLSEAAIMAMKEDDHDNDHHAQLIVPEEAAVMDEEDVAFGRPFVHPLPPKQCLLQHEATSMISGLSGPSVISGLSHHSSSSSYSCTMSISVMEQTTTTIGTTSSTADEPIVANDDVLDPLPFHHPGAAWGKGLIVNPTAFYSSSMIEFCAADKNSLLGDMSVETSNTGPMSILSDKSDNGSATEFSSCLSLLLALPTTHDNEE